MNDKLMKAILAMDSYSRGYDRALEIDGVAIGNATIATFTNSEGQTVTLDSAVLVDNNGARLDDNIGFYAVAYDYNGEKVISYRGTDAQPLDGMHGWTLGSGLISGPLASEQGLMAIDFYNAVLAGSPSTNIDLTGHSLGGGLAGLMASLHDKDALIYDTMTFESAAEVAHYVSTHYNVAWTDAFLVSHTDVLSHDELETLESDSGNTILSAELLNEDLKTKIYGATDPGDIQDIDLNGITGHYIDGEVLETMLPVRGGVAEEGELNLGPNVDLVPVGLLAEGTALHSMATLVIRIFAHPSYNDETAYTNSNVWEAAAQYFWPVLYDGDFAHRAGIAAPGKMLIDAEQAGSDFNGYASILRSIIAYSAIDEGERPFGDTAIRAYWHDANKLGHALSFSSISQNLPIFAKVISESFAEFAGVLAMSKILQTDQDISDATAGVLSLYDDPGISTDVPALIVNFSLGRWYAAAGNAPHPAVARDDIFEVINQSLVDEALNIVDVTLKYWDDGTSGVFDRLILNTNDAGTITIAAPSWATTKGAVVIGGLGAETINGSAQNELFYGDTGNDNINGKGGNDIFIDSVGIDNMKGWEGNDVFLPYGTASNGFATDLIHGGAYTNGGTSGAELPFATDGSDTVDFSHLNFGIRVGLESPTNAYAWGYNRGANYNNFSSFGSKLTMRSIETAFGTNQDDYLKGGIAKTLLMGGGGSDVFIDGAGNDSMYGEDGNDIFEIGRGGQDSIYGGAGTDTVYINTGTSNLTVRDLSTDTYRDEKGLLNYTLDSIENPLQFATGSNGGMLMDYLSHDYDFLLGTHNGTYDYSHANVSGEFVFDYRTSSPSLFQGKYGRFGDIQHDYSFFTDSPYRSTMYGTNNGDDVKFFLAYTHGIIFHAGAGNDHIESWEANGPEGTGVQVIYHGGDDVIENGYVFGAIRLWEGISYGDLTLTEEIISKAGGIKNFNLTINIANHGTLQINNLWVYQNWPTDFLTEIKLDSGGQIYLGYDTNAFSGTGTIATTLKGSWGDDSLFAHVGYNETFYGKGGDDRIVALDGDDTIFGGDGNDLMEGGDGNDTLDGGSGDDVFVYSSGIDIFKGAGNSGDDTVRLLAVSDLTESSFIVSGTNLLIYPGTGSDQLTLENYVAFEWLQFGAGAKIALANLGDWIYANGTTPYTGTDDDDTILGDVGYNTISGDSGADIIFAAGGNDILRGDEGNDVLDGGDGNDQIYGYEDDDTIFGGDGVDKLRGGVGNDTLYGGAGNDQDVNAEAGNDTLYGEDGDDKLRGGTDNDALFGGAGNDLLYGDTDDLDTTGGNDTIDGGAGNDSLRGGHGNDTYVASAGVDDINDLGGVDTISFGAGVAIQDITIDSVSGDANDIAVVLGTDQILIENQLDTAGSLVIETLAFADGSIATLARVADWIYTPSGGGTTTGLSIADTIIGDAGNDTINGLGGNDELFGAGGDDSLRGGGGDDQLHGGDGINTAIFSGAYGNYVFSGNTIEDTVGTEGTDTFFSIQRFRFYDGTYENGVFTPSSTNDTLTATAAADVLDGGAGTDTADYSGSNAAVSIDLLNGTANGGYARGDSLLSIENLIGSAYADTLGDGTGNSALSGGLGGDTYIYRGGLDTVTDTGGADTLVLANASVQNTAFAFSGNDLVITINAGTNEVRIINQAISASAIETVRFADGFEASLTAINSWIISSTSVHGSNGVDDTIILGSADHTSYGYSGNDRIHGGAGIDILRGNEGADLIFGGAGNDDLQGNDGDDLVDGGDGVDKLRGGLGNDVLNAGAGDDTDVRAEEGDDTVNGGDGNDTLYGDYNSSDTITGHDTLDGGAGNDSLYGGLGSDTYLASNGADYVNDRGGADAIRFGAGISIFSLVFANDPGDTNDQIITFGSNTIQVENQTESSGAYAVETLLFADGTYANFANILDWDFATTGGGTIHGSYTEDDTMVGNTGNDSFYGKDGNDQLFGGAGDDYLRGDAGNDILVGGAGNDDMKGDDGDDMLYAGAGADRLEGMAGADSYIFQGAEIVDGNLNRIVGFSQADNDVLILEDVLQGYDPLIDAISDFITMSTTSHTYLSIDVDGKGEAFNMTADVIRLESITAWSSVSDMITQGDLQIAA